MVILINCWKPLCTSMRVRDSWGGLRLWAKVSWFYLQESQQVLMMKIQERSTCGSSKGEGKSNYYNAYLNPSSQRPTLQGKKLL